MNQIVLIVISGGAIGSFEGGQEFFVDPGTFAYHTEGEWRAYFRGTAAHNTVRIDGLDQSQPGGNFMWLRKAGSTCTRWAASEARDIFEGRHDGYLRLPDSVLHRRRIILEKAHRRVVIEDALEMAGEHAIELFLHCSPECEVKDHETGAAVIRGERTLKVRWPDLAAGEARVLHGSLDPLGGWVSRGFDRKEPAATLVWSARISGSCVLRTEIDCLR